MIDLEKSVVFKTASSVLNIAVVSNNNKYQILNQNNDLKQ